jgi:hypothetical protein
MDILRLVSESVLSQGFHHIHGSPVAWKVHDGDRDRTLLYVSAERDKLRGFEFTDQFVVGADPAKDPIDTFHSHCPNSSHGMPGGFMSLSANGGDPETGIVWVSMPRRNQDALHHIVPGVLRAYRAFPKTGDELEELWNSDSGIEVARPDCSDPPVSGDSEVGLFAKYAPPTIAEGKVYVPTFSGRLAVYGLRSSGPPAAPGAGWDARLTTEGLPDVVAPGQTVAVKIRAQNTGTASWRPGDKIHLESRRPNQLEEIVAEDRDALFVRREVPPQGSYELTFRITMPEAEGTQHYRWRLLRDGEGDRPGQRLGQPSPEWRARVLKPQCADLRARLSVISAQASAPRLTPAQQDEALAIKREGEARSCLLNMDTMSP